MSHKLKIKQVDLSGVQQDNSKNRFLVIDSNGNIAWNNSPVSADSITYTNVNPIQSALGGITVGQTFSQNTMKEMWDMLLYPYLAPSFSSFTVSDPKNIEVGQSLAATLSFAWDSQRDSNVQPGSISITDPSATLITGQNSDSTASAITTYTYSTPVKLNSYGSYTWTITGQTTKGQMYSTVYSKNWWWKIYWGSSTSANSPTQTFIKGLQSSQIQSSRTGDFACPANGYKYLAIPAAYGIPTSIYYAGLPVALADSADGYNSISGSITYTQISITNNYGISSQYNIFRTKNQIIDSISLKVS